jgi:hypothetical protein
MAWHPARIALVAVDGFAAISAVGGGMALALGLEGERFAPELLRGTPFRSYVVPGALLAGVVGKSALWATIATAASPRAGGAVSVAAGAVMMGWIAGEVAVLRAPEARSPVEAAYFGVGAAMAGLGLAVALRDGAGRIAPAS